jgi:maleate cis-trans isomerase
MKAQEELRKIAVAKLQKQAEKFVKKLIRQIEKSARNGKLGIHYVTPYDIHLDTKVLDFLLSEGFEVSLSSNGRRYVSW